MTSSSMRAVLITFKNPTKLQQVMKRVNDLFQSMQNDPCISYWAIIRLILRQCNSISQLQPQFSR